MNSKKGKVLLFSWAIFLFKAMSLSMGMVLNYPRYILLHLTPMYAPDDRRLHMFSPVAAFCSRAATFRYDDGGGCCGEDVNAFMPIEVPFFVLW